MLQNNVQMRERLTFKLSASRWTFIKEQRHLRVLLGTPTGGVHSPCRFLGFIHSFIYAPTDALHKKLRRKDFSLERFKLFDASFAFIIILHESVLDN